VNSTSPQRAPSCYQIDLEKKISLFPLKITLAPVEVSDDGPIAVGRLTKRPFERKILTEGVTADGES